MRIDTAARETGLSRDMIRHYEKLGLVRPRRLENGYRDYSADDLYLLTVVKYLSNLGVPLREIARAFETGGTGAILGRLSGEIDRLSRLKAQLDARIAAAEHSLRCFGQYAEGAGQALCEAPARWLISHGEGWADAEAAQRAVADHGGFFQFYFRQRATWRDGVVAVENLDRGLLLFERLAGAEPLPAQRCLRLIITHRPGRLVGAHDLEAHVREAARLTGRDAFTVLTHQLFKQRGALEEENR